jgi:non-specific serine/threonine protein kinase
VGDRAGSRALFVRALSLSRRLNNLRAIAGCFEGLAYLSADAGDARSAARLIGAAARLRTITAAPLLPQWTRAHDQCRDRIAEAIGPEEAAGQEMAGAQLPVDALAAEIVGG